MDPTKVAQVVKLLQVGTLVQAIAKRFAISIEHRGDSRRPAVSLGELDSVTEGS